MDNLVLVGFSCSGKTTIGRLLARRLRLAFVDTDKVVEQGAGRTIPTIFRDDGEAAFRRLEREAVVYVCRGRYQVISTGGGAFVDAKNRDVLRNRNLVVHLRVRPETVVQRLHASRSGRPRPLLDTPNPLERVRHLMAARRHAYSLAHVTLDVDDHPTQEVVAELARHWSMWRRVLGAGQSGSAASA